MNDALRVLLLAGDRGPGDPLARRFNVAGKAAVPLAGRPMLAHVVERLSATPGIDRIQLLGPAQALWSGLQPALAPWRDRLDWCPPEAGPSASAAAAAAGLEADEAVLMTTADHPLLQPAMISDFLAGVAATPEAEACVAMVPYAAVRARFPGARRTRYRFRDGDFCGANLFWFRGRGLRRLAELWQEVERQRKRPWRVARLLGPVNLLRFLARRLDLAQAFELLSRRAGVRAGAVVLPHAEAAVDVDSLMDLALVEAVLRERQARQ